MFFKSLEVKSLLDKFSKESGVPPEVVENEYLEFINKYGIIYIPFDYVSNEYDVGSFISDSFHFCNLQLVSSYPDESDLIKYLKESILNMCYSNSLATNTIIEHKSFSSALSYEFYISMLTYLSSLNNKSICENVIEKISKREIIYTDLEIKCILLNVSIMYSKTDTIIKELIERKEECLSLLKELDKKNFNLTLNIIVRYNKLIGNHGVQYNPTAKNINSLIKDIQNISDNLEKELLSNKHSSVIKNKYEECQHILEMLPLDESYFDDAVNILESFN